MLKLTWFGTASLSLRCDAGSLLFDPFFPLPGGEAPTKPEDYDRFPDILITHGHVDHIASLPEIVRRNPSVKIRCTEAPARALVKKGIPESNLIRLSLGEPFEAGGFTVTAYPGKHAVLPKASFRQLKRIFISPNARNLPWLLKQLPVCREAGETVLYEIRADGKTVTLMGSMNLREEVDYPTGSDYLILPYNGWEDNFPPAVRVVERLKPKQVLLDHYDDTFPPVSGPVDRKPILEKYGSLVRELRYETIEL